MVRLISILCTLTVAALVMIGGCLPMDENTWSESPDFGGLDEFLQDMSATYDVTNNLDGGFTVLTLNQAGATFSGRDNKGRAWHGKMSGGSGGGGTGQISLETNDDGGAFIVGNVVFFVDGDRKHKGIDAVFTYGGANGWIICIGPYKIDEGGK